MASVEEPSEEAEETEETVEQPEETKESAEEGDPFAGWLRDSQTLVPPSLSNFEVPDALRNHYARPDTTPLACVNRGHYGRVKRNRNKMRKKLAKKLRSPKKLRTHLRKNMIHSSRRNPLFPAFGSRSCFDPKLIALDTPGYNIPKAKITRKSTQGFRLVKESASKICDPDTYADRFPKTKPASKLEESGPVDWNRTRPHSVPFNQEGKRSGPLQWSRQYIERRGRTGAVYTEKNILRFTSTAAPGQIDHWPRELETVGQRHMYKGAFDNSKRWDTSNVGSYLHSELASTGKTPGPKFMHPGVSLVQPKISHFGNQQCPRVLFSHKKMMGATHTRGGHSPGPLAKYEPMRGLDVTRHSANKTSFGSGFDGTRKVKMKKFVPAHSLKDDLRALHKSPGVPHRTEQELERTGRAMFIGKLVDDNNEMPKFKKKEQKSAKAAAGSDSDDDSDDDAEARAARDKAMLEAQTAKLRELMSS